MEADGEYYFMINKVRKLSIPEPAPPCPGALIHCQPSNLSRVQSLVSEDRRGQVVAKHRQRLIIISV